ncbi:MAG: hypothetical protein OXI48_07265 [bacterium]|nr:hypothetical protein [bacterium]
MKRLAATLTIVVVIIAGCVSESEPEAAPTNARELFEGCVSAWDGNHDGLEARMRARLNDPGSMETHATYYNPDDSISDGEIAIRVDYSAANAFGGMVRTNAWASMGLDCEITAVTDYGF